MLVLALLYHHPSLLVLVSTPPPDAPKDCLSFSSARFREAGLDLWIPSSSSWKPNSSPLTDWEPLRIARGLPLWGIDVDATTLPPEAGFESDAISSTKGCYIGQEVISRLRSVGHVNRHLCILGSTNPPKLRPHAPAEGIRSEGGPPSHLPTFALPLVCKTSHGAEAGKITSLTPVDGEALALAMLQRAHADPGNSVLAGEVTWTILRHA